jgi:hypothetical protein
MIKFGAIYPGKIRAVHFVLSKAFYAALTNPRGVAFAGKNCKL